MSYAKRQDNALKASVTFVVTEECNLRCKYCYEEDKKKSTLDIETVKKALKIIKKNYTRFDTVCWDFIGGEPLMEPELIDEIITAIREEFHGHKWMEDEFYSICTNGTLFSDPKVKKLLNKYSPMMQVGLSLDGIKEIHDLNRSNSFDRVMKDFIYWRTKYPGQTTKSTINREALPYVYDNFKFLVEDLDLTTINMNTIYENVWVDGDEVEYKKQLIKVADWLLETGRYQTVNTNLFPISMTPSFLKNRMTPNSEERKGWCGSGSCMLAVGVDGLFYPCMRFFTATPEHRYQIGNVDDGIDMDRVRPFYFTCKQTGEGCSKCEYESVCPHCLAWDFQTHHTIFKRAEHSCKMLIAQFEAAKYYYSQKEE